MAITKQKFGIAPNGEDVELYSIINSNGMQADIMTYGAALVNLFIKDDNKKFVDVNLGYDDFEPYTGNTDNFGATIGPNCNRMGNAEFSIGGVTYKMPVNDGENNLHTDGENGISKRVWDAIPADNHLVLTTVVKAGEAGLPANKFIRLTYTLSDNNELRLHYEVQCDGETIVNMTNHAYFNLDGHESGTIADHILKINAAKYTVLRKGGIPTGEIADVKGTALDFTKERRIGDALENGDEQTALVGGIDHNFVLDNFDGSLRLAAVLSSPKSNRTMKVFTNLPGLQIYTGNFIGNQKAKDGAEYGKNSGIAMETQFFPDAPNHDNFPSTVFDRTRRYDYTTIYRFEG